MKGNTEMRPAGDREPSSREILCLLAMVLFALVSRVQYSHSIITDEPIRGDRKSYLYYGVNLATHGMFSHEYGPEAKPDSFRSPGFPLLIAAAALVVGVEHCFAATIYAQALMGAALVAMVFFLGLRFLPKWACFLAAGAMALCPHQTSMSFLLLTENQFSFLLAASALAILRADERQSFAWAAGAGALAGLCYLTNEAYLFLPMLFAAAWFLSSRRKNDRRGARLAVVFLCVFMAMPLAWGIRNRVSVAPGSLTGGNRALLSIVAGAYPGYRFQGKFDTEWYKMDPDFSAMSRDPAVALRVLGSRFRERPLRFLSWYLFEKPYYFWRWKMIQGEGITTYWSTSDIYKDSRVMALVLALMWVLYHAALLLALAGAAALAVRWRRKTLMREVPAAFLVLAHLVYFTLLYQVFCALPRYSVPLRPFLYLFAAYGAWSLASFLGRNARPVRPPVRAAAATAAALAFAALAVGTAVETRDHVGFSFDEMLVDADYVYAKSNFWAGYQYFEAGEYRDAEKCFEKSLGPPDLYPKAKAVLGRIAFKEDRYRDAALLFRDALAEQPEQLESLYGIFLSLKAMGRQDLALAWFSRLRRFHPENGDVKAVFARYESLLSRERDPAEEGGQEKKTARLLERASMQRALGLLAEAEQSIEEAGALRPGYAPIAIEQALLYMDQEKASLAKKILADLGGRFPDNPGLLYNQACVASRSGDTGAARSFLQQAVSKGFSNNDYLQFDPDLSNLRKAGGVVGLPAADNR